ncbi:MAG TPA: phosphatase PAP2 family protein [Phycisphaerae bacterium]|nr:phosphatase PAP2 family protein [Phycisphaerae bacterium]
MPSKLRSLATRTWRWTRGQEPLVLAGILVLAGLSWAFIEVADEVAEGNSQDAELAIMRSLRDPADTSRPKGPRWLANAALEWTALGAAPILTIIVLSVTGYLFLVRRTFTATFILASVVGGTILTNLLKGAFGRARPAILPELTEHLSPSFPSGHSLMAAVVYLTLGATLASAARQRRQKFYILGVALFLTLLVGCTRVYLGVHYPTDVLAGWCLGAAWAILCWLVARWLQRRRPTALNK